MKVLEKIQNLPEKQRKKILWAVIVIIGIVLIFFWFRIFQENIGSFDKENLLEEINPPNINLE